MNHLIKICGVTDANIAKQAAFLGADMIGIVFYPPSPRYVSIEKGAEIANAVKKFGAKPVAIFVNHTYPDMRAICEATGIQTVQLHGHQSRAEHYHLPDHYQRLYVLNLSTEGGIKYDAGFRFLNPLRDFVLIDHIHPGQGKPIAHRKIYYDLPFPWILAGGLSPLNVISAIKFFQPHGLDVSSGVEILRGHKDISLIHQFILSIRGYHHDA